MTPVHAGIVHQPSGQSTVDYLTLEQVNVNAWVVDVSSRIVLTQTFYNPSDEPTGRAKYVFPLPANAAVCAFELELEDGSVIIGEVKEREEAALTFTRALEQGKTTALVERVTDDIFTISVGSIPATTRVRAYLTFVMDLLDEGLRDHVRLQLPMHIAERYGTPPAALQDASAADSQTRVHISVDVQTSDVINHIDSPTHKVSLRSYKGRSGQALQRRMSVVWKSSKFLDSDFVIRIHAQGLDKPRCFAEALGAGENGDGAGSTIAMQLTLVPKFFAPKVRKQEYIFIIDRSGSMAGTPIETAKRTLTMLLRLLPSTQTTFNIFSFGSEVTSLWQSSRGLDQGSLSEATTHVASMGADFGGTETPKALQSAFKSRGLDRPAAVFLLTDGAIHGSGALDPGTVVSNAVHNSPPEAFVRLFVLGIGTGVSSDVCASLAQQGNGEYMFALLTEDIVGKCARLLNAGRSKNIEYINIDWGHDASSTPRVGFPSTLPAGIVALAPPPPVQQAPHVLKKIFSGIRFTIFAVTSFKAIPTSIKLTTKLEGVPDPQELMIEVTKVKPFRDTDAHSIVPIVHTLAARKLIMELDNGRGPLPTAAPSDALLASEGDLRKAGIVRLGLTYQLVSQHTSFVAVQKGNERTRNRRRGGGGLWARSRLRQTSASTEAAVDSPVVPEEDPTFFDGLIDSVVSFFGSLFGYPTGPAAPKRTTNRTNMKTSSFRSQHQPEFPGAFNGSDSGIDEDDGRSRGHSRASTPTRQRSASRHSVDTYSTMSSLGGSSSCSACWTPSRSPSPQPRFQDPIERAPTPDIQQTPGLSVPSSVPQPGTSSRRAPISQEVYSLFLGMAADGSFAATPLLVELVGDAVLNEADSKRIDKKVWTTVVVVAYMQKHLQDELDLLELVSEKAREFVEGLGGTNRGGDRQFEEMVREAGRLLGP